MLSKMAPPTFRIDKYTTYYINYRDEIIVDMGPREACEYTRGDQPVQRYSKEDVRYFHLNRVASVSSKTSLDDETGFVIHKDFNLLFIPLSNKKGEILDYGIANYDKIKILGKETFHRSLDEREKTYVKTNKNISLHELIFGRKAREGFKLDHKHSNGLDNRTSQINEITNSANSANVLKKEGTSSQFLGVSFRERSKKWVATVKGIELGTFLNEIDAARVRDMYTVLYYNRDVRLNFYNYEGIISEEEINNIIVNGIDGIPIECRKKEKKKRDLPKYICRDKSRNCYRYDITYNKKTYNKRYKTLEETERGLEIIQEKIRKLKEEDKLLNEPDIEENRNSYGIAVIKTYKDGEIVFEFEVDDVDWLKYNKSNLGGNRGDLNMDKERKGLHVRIYEDMFPDHDYRSEGKSIDHFPDTNPRNCRRNNLRAATQSQQVQNTKRVKRTIVHYSGVYLAAKKFYAVYKRKTSKTFVFMEDAAREYNRMALEDDPGSRINIVPDTKTTTTDLYHKDNLTIEFIQKLSIVDEIYTIFTVNKDWKKIGKVVTSKINSKNVETYKNILLKLKLENL